MINPTFGTNDFSNIDSRMELFFESYKLLNIQAMNLNNQANLNIETKIKLNLENCRYLYIEKGKFLIYTLKEIFLFDKKLSSKKLFLSKNKNDVQIYFIKKMNNGNFLCLNNNDLYIFTIKPVIIINKIIKFKSNQHIDNAIEFRNGILIAQINQKIFFSIKLKNIKDEIKELFRIPDDCFVKNRKIDSNYMFVEFFKLPLNNNAILIHTFSLAIENIRNTNCGNNMMMQFSWPNHYIKEKVFSFNVDERKIKDYIQTLEFETRTNFYKLDVLVSNKYIFILKDMNNLLIYNIYDYILIKQITIFFPCNLSYRKSYNAFELMFFDGEIMFPPNNCFHFDETIIFEENDGFTSYDMTDINNVERKFFNFKNIKIPFESSSKGYRSEIFHKFSNRKFISKRSKDLYIIKY